MAHNYDLLLVAKDFGESRQLEELANELKGRGRSVHACLAHGSPDLLLSESIMRSLCEQSKLVVVAPGNDPEPELIAAEASAKLGKLVFYTNGPRDQHLASYRPMVTGVIYTTGEEKGLIQRLYPKANITSVGNPLHEEWGKPDMPTREEARKYFNVAKDDTLVALSFDKYTGDNFLTYSTALEALLILREHGYSLRIVAGFHPGDPLKKNPDLQREIYSQFFARMGFQEARLIDPSKDTLDLRRTIPGADLVIGAVSTIVLQGAAFRIPSVSMRSYPINRMLTAMHGSPYWPPHDYLNGVYHVRTGFAHRALAHTLGMLLDTFSPESRKMREAQEAAFPGPFTPGTSVKMAADAIDSLLSET